MKAVGIRGKLMTAFLCFIVAIAFEGLVSIYYINNMSGLFDGMYHDNLVPLNKFKTLEASIRDHRLKTYQYLGTLDPDKMEILQKTIGENTKLLNKVLVEEGVEVQGLKDLFDIYVKLNESIIDKHFNFDTSGAYAAIAGESLVVYEKLMKLAQDMTDSKQDIARKSLDRGHGIQKTILIVMTFVILSSSILSFVVAFLLANNLTRPILKIRDSLHHLGKGILDKHLPDKVLQRKDELGAMAQDYAVTQHALAELISNIQAILKNIPQGIMTVTEGNVIHPEYSDYLEDILQTNEIGGKSVMELLFGDHSNLGADTLDQVQVGLSCVIGEDSMIFDMNAHLFIKEFERTMPNGQKAILEVDWSPIYNQNDETEKVMITLRDVTEIRKLQESSKEQKRNLEIMLEILAISPEKFTEFIETSNKTLQANKELVEAHLEKDNNVVAALFRNLHTVKGNARTYGFLHITQTVHEAERRYVDLRENDTVEWNQPELLDDLKAVNHLLEEYSAISTDQLGRKAATPEEKSGDYEMVLSSRVDQMLRAIEGLDMKNVRAMQKSLNEIRNTLKLIGTIKLKDSLHSVVDSLPSLAEDLGKLPPKVMLNDNNIWLKKDVDGLLKNSFVHLLRNSVDHGIETAEEREKAKKTPAGTIQVDMSLTTDYLRFVVKDDGRGINLNKLRERAIEKGLMKETDHYDEQDVANFIFHSGFSTAQKVTDVSGRGVGLDAVKEFFENYNGSIYIELIKGTENAGFFPFKFILTLPTEYAVPIEEVEV